MVCKVGFIDIQKGLGVVGYVFIICLMVYFYVGFFLLKKMSQKYILDTIMRLSL